MENQTTSSSQIVTGVMIFVMFLCILCIPQFGLGFGWSITISMIMIIGSGIFTAVITQPEEKEESDD